MSKVYAPNITGLTELVRDAANIGNITRPVLDAWYNENRYRIFRGKIEKRSSSKVSKEKKPDKKVAKPSSKDETKLSAMLKILELSKTKLDTVPKNWNEAKIAMQTKPELQAEWKSWFPNGDTVEDRKRRKDLILSQLLTAKLTKEEVNVSRSFFPESPKQAK
jgi:hypothetical protein